LAALTQYKPVFPPIAVARLPEIATVEQVVAPRLLDTFAREILGIPGVADPPLGLEGDGQIIGIADTGLDDTHPDFAGRVTDIRAWGRLGPPPDHSDPEGHGTHVAGCAAGDGTASGGEVKGAAPKAKIFFQSILDANDRLGGLPEDLGDLFDEAYKAGVRIHNNSWGAFSYAQYSINSLSVDRYVAAHPDMLVVIAAGNEGTGMPRGSDGKMNAQKGFVDWPSVTSPAIAKNGLTVGASRSSGTSGGYAQLTWGETWADRYPSSKIAKDTISGAPDCPRGIQQPGTLGRPAVQARCSRAGRRHRRCALKRCAASQILGRLSEDFPYTAAKGSSWSVQLSRAVLEPRHGLFEEPEGGQGFPQVDLLKGGPPLALQKEISDAKCRSYLPSKTIP
jgi:hypothetical protein